MNKKRFTLILLPLFIIVILLVGTQTFAAKTGYHKSLGNSSLVLEDKIPIYYPWKILFWLKYQDSAPNAFQNAIDNMTISGVICFLLIVFINKKKKKITVHGSAEWASKEDIDKMGFFPYKENKYKKEYEYSGIDETLKKNIYNIKPYIKLELPKEKIKKIYTFSKFLFLQKRFKNNEYRKHGVFLGRDKWGRDLIDMSSGHVMMIAKTGGGKGVSVVLTTLFTWKGSTLVNDIKGENWLYTAGYRRSLGHKVFRFHATAEGKLDEKGEPIGNPESLSCHYNPMEEIRKGTDFEYQDARMIAETIISPNKLKDPFFGPSGVNYLTAVILHVLYMVNKRTANLSDVYNFITSPQFTEDQRLNQMIKEVHNSDGEEDLFQKIYNDVIILSDGQVHPRVHPKVSRTARDMIDRADKERSGIIGSAKVELEAFAVPTIARNTAYSDFRISDLMNHETPVDLYFVTPPNSVDITSVLMKLFINQLTFRLTNNQILNEKGENIAFKHRLLILFDELPAVGRIDLFHKAVSYYRGYGIKLLLIIQDMKQLKEVYGENNSFLGNMSTTIYYSTNDVDTARYIETRLGKRTEKIITRSYGVGGILFRKNLNFSEQYVGRPLMTSEEIHNMSENESIILSAGKKPIKGKLAKWFLDDEFKNRFARTERLQNNSLSDKIIIQNTKKKEDKKNG